MKHTPLTEAQELEAGLRMNRERANLIALHPPARSVWIIKTGSETDSIEIASTGHPSIAYSVEICCTSVYKVSQITARALEMLEDECKQQMVMGTM